MLASEEVFQDYTVATSLERFIATIEEVVSSWISAGVVELSAQQALQGISAPPGCLEVQASVQHHLSFRNEAYILTLHADAAEASVRSTQAKHSRQPQQPADLPSHTDLSGPEPSPSLGEDCNQSFLERSGSPQRRPGMHEQSAEGPSEYSRAAAGHSKTHQTAMGKHRGWPGICPGAVLNGHHKVQTWLGVRTFLSLVPASYSRRILNDQEGSTLQSALCAALSSIGCPWPAVIPMHDPLRDACWGVAVTCSGTSAFLDSDSIHISNLPEKLLHVEGLLGLFGQRLGPHAPRAAAAVAAVATDMSLGSMSSSAAGQPPAAYARNVTLSERRTYRIPPPVALLDEGSGNESSSELEWRQEWDTDSAWRPWAVYPDPVGRLELDIMWDQVPASSAVQQEPLNPSSASAWRVHVIDPAHAQTYGHSAFSLHSQEPKRVHLQIAHEPLQPNRWADRDTTFAGMLQNLVDSTAAASEAKSMEQLAAAEWWELRGAHAPELPPEPTLQDVLRDLVEAPTLPSAFNRGFPCQAAAGPAAEDRCRLKRCEGTAPPGALASRLAVHALVFPNARAIAALWSRLVRELRFAQWEARAPLPRMRSQQGARLRGPNSHWQASVLADMTGGMPDAPDLGACILHQKLQMLNCCIFLIRHPDAAFISLSLPSTGATSDAQSGLGQAHETVSAGQFVLLHMPQLVTFDMLVEREAALAAAGHAGEAARARLQAPLLRQCMQAFKAALPEAQLDLFRTFLRQHQEALGLDSQVIDSHQIEAMWEQTQGAAAEQQKVLWSVELEGERALHYFETLPPEAAFAQLLRLGLSSALHLLACSEGATLPPAESALQRCGTQLQALCAERGPSREDTVKVLEALRWAERIVVTGEALMQRLLGRRQLVQSLLESCIDDTESSHADYRPAQGSGSGASGPNTSSAQATKDENRSHEGQRGTVDVYDHDDHSSKALPEHSEAHEQRQQDNSSQSMQACSSSGVHAGTALTDRANIAFMCCLLDRQQQEDIQNTAEGLEGILKAKGQKELSTVDWDQPLQSTRVLDCESTETQLVQAEPLTVTRLGPRLGHRLFARTRPGELRLGTVLISEQ